jgi:phosphoglycerate dehydrogenase-like enzyme
VLFLLINSIKYYSLENNDLFFLQDTPPLDVERVTQTLKEKNVQPSTLKFGFLGLGIMGSGMVKNLLNSGHKVIVWNRTTEKVRHQSQYLFLIFR